MNYLRRTFLWILLLPYALGYLGAASNQLVLVANHGCFPVMMNGAWTDHTHPDPSTGMLADDSVHCEMTSQTHLNFLADVFNFHAGILSIGDLLLDAGDAMLPYTWGIWLGLILTRRERDGEHKLQAVQCSASRSEVLPLRLRP
jgi:hypothetical protein